jgi:ribosome-associated protein
VRAAGPPSRRAREAAVTLPIAVNESLTIPAALLSWSAVRASGPGGQNVNKVASKVEFRFDFAAWPELGDAAKARLRSLARGRLDAEGRLLVVSQRTRDQQRNLEDAREKVRQLVERSLEAPTPRKATRPSRAAKARRLENKRLVGTKKRARKGPDLE